MKVTISEAEEKGNTVLLLKVLSAYGLQAKMTGNLIIYFARMENWNSLLQTSFPTKAETKESRQEKRLEQKAGLIT